MRAALTMHESISGPTDGAVSQYQVGNPAVAYIRQFGERGDKRWRILRLKPDGDLAEPEGEFRTADYALRQLNSQVAE